MTMIARVIPIYLPAMLGTQKQKIEDLAQILLMSENAQIAQIYSNFPLRFNLYLLNVLDA